MHGLMVTIDTEVKEIPTSITQTYPSSSVKVWKLLRTKEAAVETTEEVEAVAEAVAQAGEEAGSRELHPQGPPDGHEGGPPPPPPPPSAGHIKGRQCSNDPWGPWTYVRQGDQAAIYAKPVKRRRTVGAERAWIFGLDSQCVQYRLSVEGIVQYRFNPATLRRDDIANTHPGNIDALMYQSAIDTVCMSYGIP